MKKVYKVAWSIKILTSLLVTLFVFNSCNHKGGMDQFNTPQEAPKDDPDLILTELMIFEDDLDIDNLEALETKVLADTITSTDIIATFNYGKETERIAVVIEGGVFQVDKTKPTIMKFSVPPIKGLYKGYKEISVKVSVKMQDMPNLQVGFADSIQQDGAQVELESETVELVVQCKEDIVDKAIINDGSKDSELRLEKRVDQGGIEFYGAFIIFTLSTDNYTTYRITVKPKEPNVYNEKIVSYRIKGKKVADNNAEFIYLGDNPDVICDISWEKGCESVFYEDYGAKTLKMTARTASPRASVFVKTVNPLDDSIIGSETKLQNDKGVHTGNITLFTDKPTKLIAYVKAENGTTTNDEKGKWQVVFNSVILFYSYTKDPLATKDLREKANKAYEKIEVNKNETTEGKVYIAFDMWGEELGFKPQDKVLKMKDYEQLDTYGGENKEYRTTHLFSFDVSNMNSNEETEIEIPIMRITNADGDELSSPINAFKYKFKVKIN